MLTSHTPLSWPISGISDSVPVLVPPAAIAKIPYLHPVLEIEDRNSCEPLGEQAIVAAAEGKWFQYRAGSTSKCNFEAEIGESRIRP